MDVYRTQHDVDGDVSLAGTVVEAVATVSDADPTEMERLHDVVDPDALDRLFGSFSGSRRGNGQGRVEFAFEGYGITVTSGGEVEVRGPPEGRDPDDVTTEEEFEEALAHLVRTAEANGVDVDGGWTCRDGSDRPDWGVEVYEVREPSRVD